MKLTSLISRLGKLGIENRIFDGNGYNKNLAFTVNGTTYYASFTSSDTTIKDICKITGYNQDAQETERQYFVSLRQVLKDAGYRKPPKSNLHPVFAEALKPFGIQ